MKWIDVLVYFPALSIDGIIMLIVSIHSLRYWRGKMSRERARVPGTIVDYSRKVIRGARGRRTVLNIPVVAFSAEGVEQKLPLDYGMEPSRYPVGTAVEVLYDPDDPKRFHIDTGEPEDEACLRMIRHGILWIMCAAVAALVLAWCASRFGFSLEKAPSGRAPAFKAAAPQVEARFSYREEGEFAAVITGYSGSDAAVTIPTILDGRVVTGFAPSAFSANTALKSVTIPGAIGEISAGAFAGCLRLKEVDMREGIRTIGMMSFSLCASLEKVTLPASVEWIADNAFPDDCAAEFSVARDSAAERHCAGKGYRVVYN